MQKRVPQVPGDLIIFASRIADGAKYCEPTLPLLLRPEAKIREKITLTQLAIEKYHKAKADLSARRDDLAGVIITTRAFLTLARDNWKPRLGNAHNSNWTVAGLREGSLMIPRTENELALVAEGFARFLAEDASYELPQQQITAVSALEVAQQLRAAIFAVVTHKSALNQAKKDRDNQIKALTKIVRDTIGELNIQLDPMDSRWLSFGLRIPGITQPPETPEKIEVIEISPAVATVAWEPAPRAEYYRVWEKDEEGDLIPIATRHACDISLELSPDKQREFAMTAVNDRGESPHSSVVVVPKLPSASTA